MKKINIIVLVSALMLTTFSINAQYKPDAADEAALKLYTKRIESNPKDFDAYFERGKLYLKVGYQKEKAVRDFTKAIELDPGSIKSYLERAKIYGFDSEPGEKDVAKVVSLIKDAQDKSRTGARKYSDEELNYCPVPQPSDYIATCNEVTLNGLAPDKYHNKFSYLSEKKLWEMSCAFPDYDSGEEAIPKVQSMWSKHKLKFDCAGQGNILKFALSEGKENFIEVIVENYDLDISFKDVDGKTVLNFINDEIKRRYIPGKPNATATLREYKDLLISLGAKPSIP